MNAVETDLRKDWARRPGTIGETHYISRWTDHEDGMHLLHANPECSALVSPIPFCGRTVDALWEADCNTRAGGEKALIWWCENCAVFKNYAVPAPRQADE